MRMRIAGMIAVLGVCLGLWALVLSYVSVLLGLSVLRPYVQVLSVLVGICFVVDVTLACMKGKQNESEKANESNSWQSELP